MSAEGGAAEIGDFRAGADFDARGFGEALSSVLKPAHLECSPPFLVGWYNRTREDTAGGLQPIEAGDSVVAFAIYSVPGYLDTVAEHFFHHAPEKDFVDSCTNEILDVLRNRLHPDMDPLVVNTDAGPPYYHVQTIGAVAGVDQHVEASDLNGEGDEAWREELSDRLEDERDPKMWGTDPVTRRKIFGVNVHPKWGGWYAYRALLVLRGATAETLERPIPLDFLPLHDARRILLEYNLRHDQCEWRDGVEGHWCPENRYKPDEYLFFMETSPTKRKRYLQIRASQMPARPPKSRLS